MSSSPLRLRKGKLVAHGWSCQADKSQDGLEAKISIYKGKMRGIGQGAPHINFSADKTKNSAWIYTATQSSGGGGKRDLDLDYFTKDAVQFDILDFFGKLVQEGPRDY
jgi:hypothetical protein